MAWPPARTTSAPTGSTTPKARARWSSPSPARPWARPPDRGTAQRGRAASLNAASLIIPFRMARNGSPEERKRAVPLDDYRIAEEPFYRPAGGEVALYERAYAHRMPLILKGPTGCGKTRFVEYMAWKLGRPLVTLACNEDMTASDLIGRYLLDAGGTAWHDGPDPGRAPRRHLLPGRGGRGAPGHYRGHPSADRRAACCRWTRRASWCARIPTSSWWCRTTRATRAAPGHEGLDAAALPRWSSAIPSRRWRPRSWPMNPASTARPRAWCASPRARARCATVAWTRARPPAC